VRVVHFSDWSKLLEQRVRRCLLAEAIQSTNSARLDNLSTELQLDFCILLVVLTL